MLEYETSSPLNRHVFWLGEFVPQSPTKQSILHYSNQKVLVKFTKIYTFKKNLNGRLPTLYAQLRRVTLAPSVLPRRLARTLAGAMVLQ